MQLKIENSELPVGLSKTEIIKICANLWATLHLTLASAQPSPPRGSWWGASVSLFLLQSYISLRATWLQTYNRGWKEIRIIRIMSLCFDGFHRRSRGRQTAMPAPTLISIGSAIATTCLRN